MLVVFDCPNVAIPVGTEPVDQFEPLLKIADGGLRSQFAFCA
jgi:hypothetical protein